MSKTTPPSLPLETIRALCRQVARDGCDAVIVRDEDYLRCFTPDEGGEFASATGQDGYEDDDIQFVAQEETFLFKCLPDALSRIVSEEHPRLTFIDQEPPWDHAALFARWLGELQKRPPTRARHITLRGFRRRPDGTLTRTEEVQWRAEGERATRPRPARRAPPSHRPHAEAAPEAPAPALPFSRFEDVPAEFDKIVWTVRRRPSTVGKSAPDRLLEAAHSLGRCFTTAEVVSSLSAAPSLLTWIETFQHLRRAEAAQVLEVPMIGFRPKWLHAVGHLGAFASPQEVRMDPTTALALRTRHYPAAAARTLARRDRLCVAAARCLSATTHGLHLFDLTEDVIFDLTGQSGVRLSLADACRVSLSLSGDQ